MQYSQEMSKARELAEEALTLCEEARMYIVDVIQMSASVCDEGETDPEIEAAWVKVAKQRLDEIRSGRVKPIDGKEFQAKLRRHIYT